MKRSFSILGIIALLIFGMSLASFGDNQWISIGPPGIRVKAIAINPQTPDTLYIGTAGAGVLKSIDGGATCVPANNGLTTLNIMTIAINPQSPEMVYVGTPGFGMFRSTDGAASWVNTLPSHAVDAITIDPLEPTTVYAGTGGYYGNALYYGEGAFKSIDGGLTWAPINNGLPVPGGVTALAVDPQTPETLYAGASRLVFDSVMSMGVLKSTDGGITWNPTTLTEHELSVYSYVFALVIGPQTPETIYAGTWGGVFKSIDGGTTWMTIDTGLTSLFVYALAINPQTPNTLYAATSGGVFRSTDGGTNWVGINVGLPISKVETLAINPQTPDILYAGTDGFGLFKINVGAGPINPTLAVLKSGTGNGRVTSDPSGINCGTTCQASYDAGTVVTLTATAEPGSTFVGWSGECKGTGTCLVTMDNDKAVEAVSDLQGDVLRIIKSGTGSGTVTSNTGIDCGIDRTDCVQTYSGVQMVRLRASPDDDSVFAGWSGGNCSGKGICAIRVDSPTMVIADFIEKAPHIGISAASIDFGDIKMGRSMRKRLAITNNGTGDLLVTAGGLEGTDFSISGRASVTAKPKRTIYLSVVFRPTSPGPEVALLEITSNDSDKPFIDIPLAGTSGTAR
jgi:hypothetical protein